MDADNTRALLVAQMKRAIEILESEDMGRFNYSYSNELAELDNKLLEIRRDSIRCINQLRKGW